MDEQVRARLEFPIRQANLSSALDRLLVGARVEGDTVVLKTKSNVAARELLKHILERNVANG
jgi:hypothetical protein